MTICDMSAFAVAIEGKADIGCDDDIGDPRPSGDRRRFVHVPSVNVILGHLE